MSAERPRIGVPVDVKMTGDDPTHSTGEKYLAAVADAAKSIPLLLPALVVGAEMPALETEISADDMLDGLDGLFLTGSRSNMDPQRYGSNAPGVGPFDPQRDAANLALLQAAITRDLPVLAVCRGYQELNVDCGGTLHTAVQEVPGLADHRDDHERPRAQRYAPAHPITLAADGLLARLTGQHEITVNSLHGQGHRPARQFTGRRSHRTGRADRSRPPSRGYIRSGRAMASRMALCRQSGIDRPVRGFR